MALGGVYHLSRRIRRFGENFSLPVKSRDQEGDRILTRLRSRVAIGPETTFGVGGRAKYYLRVYSSHELEAALQTIKKIRVPWRILAGGSNVVFADGLWPGLVVHYQEAGRGGEIFFRGRQVTADAGVNLGRFIKETIRRGWGGLEGLSGIPGTLGGAVVGNAGAYGQAISDCLTAVTVYDCGRCCRRRLNKKQCRFAYRESIFKTSGTGGGGLVVLGVSFRLRPADPRSLDGVSRRIIRVRNGKYPPGLRCPGSFFKNVLVKQISSRALGLVDPTKIIEGKIPAGYLLEQVGAKGLRTENLEVAPHHGNLIINRHGASQKEVKRLATRLKSRVKDKFGIVLEEEVVYF